MVNKMYAPESPLDALGMILQYPLTVIVAPSGCGKTAAVQECLQRNRASYVNAQWYTASGESSIIQWKRFCAVLSKIDKRTAKRLGALEGATWEGLPEIAEGMREINCDVPTVLVVDNYQLMQRDTSFALIDALAQHENAHLHIVILTQRLSDDTKACGIRHTGTQDTHYFLVKGRTGWHAVPMGEAEDLSDWFPEEPWMQSNLFGPHISFAMMLSMAEYIPPQLARMYYFVFLACAKAMIVNPDKAMIYLKEALDIAVPDRLALLLSEHTLWLKTLLQETQAHFPSMQDLDRLLTMYATENAETVRPKKTIPKVRPALTPRERQIVQLAKTGSTNKEIGRALFISPETVKMAMKNIFKKLDIQSRYQL